MTVYIVKHNAFQILGGDGMVCASAFPSVNIQIALIFSGICYAVFLFVDKAWAALAAEYQPPKNIIGI